MRMPSSSSCCCVTGEGAPVIGSAPVFVFGKAITSRMSSSPASCATTRSRPGAKPACGGAPYSNASSMCPKRCFASSSLMPSRRNTFSCIARWWIRTLPLRQLRAVADQVVGLAADARRVGLEQRDVFLERRGEQVVERVPAVLVVVPLDERELRDERVVQRARVGELLARRDLAAEAVERGLDALRRAGLERRLAALARDEQQQVALLRARALAPPRARDRARGTSRRASAPRLP